jgi:protein FrlC
MKLGTATSVLYQYAIEDAVPIVARAGYDGIDIWGGRPHVYRRDYTAEQLSALRTLIADHGLAVSSLMPAFYRYPHSLSHPNPIVREDSIAYMRECIDNAAVLGARVVLVVPDLTLRGHSTADAQARMIESLDTVARHAAQYDLQLGIEILYHDETDYVNSADDALHIMQQLGHNNLGVVLDTGTLNLSHESPDEILTKLGDRMLQVHVNDNHGGHKQQNLIPGEGTYDFASLIVVLRRHQYTGFLSAELSREYADDPEPALRLTAERMRAWMQ